jgi:hypoxanthine phosphoribosyltransferase
MDDSVATSWKGLDPGRKPLFLSYDQTERMIAALLDRAAAWQPDAVVGIARGGLVPATMAAGLLALPLAMTLYQRSDGSLTWMGPPPAGARLLLVDDGCSTGRTMRDARAALEAEGRTCLTLAVVHDPDSARHLPDLSHPMRTLWRFPWERGEVTPSGRALRASGCGPDRSTEAPFYGLDMDGVFLPDVPRHHYDTDMATALALRHAAEPFPTLPHFTRDRAVVITGRPEADRAQTTEWLARWGYAELPLECRPDTTPFDVRSVARHKADTATRWGCTHFVESDPDQAIMIAAEAPHLVVSWWSAAEARGWLIGAAPSPGHRD